jgi:rhodanese-related sulfurtransferase
MAIRVGACLVLLLMVAGAIRFRTWYLPNFHWVRAGEFYRSGQPRGIGLRAVNLLGVRTVVSLRSREDSVALAEEKYYRSHGIRFVRVPLSWSDQKEIGLAVEQVMAIVDVPENRPVLVHCARGRERAGLVSAVFRMEQDRWSNSKAMKEMFDLGLEPGEKKAFDEFVWNYLPRWQKGEDVVAASSVPWTEAEFLND